MELVTVAHISLHRPQSVSVGGIGVPSNPQKASFVIDKDDIEILREKVIQFAEDCGVNKDYLRNMMSIPGNSHGDRVIVFDIEIQGRQFSTPYATCKLESALKIGTRCFKLSEIGGVK